MLQKLIPHWNKLFWAVFVASVLIYLAVAGNGSSFQILAGFFIIVMGAAKISEEILYKKTMRYHNDLYSKFYDLSRQLEKTVDLTLGIQSKSDSRFFVVDKKRIETDVKIEDNYRSLAKKLIEVENKLNKLTRK